MHGKTGLFKQSHVISFFSSSQYCTYTCCVCDVLFFSLFLYILIIVTTIFRLLSFSFVIRQRATDVMLVSKKKVVVLLLMILRTHISQFHRSIEKKIVSQNGHDKRVFSMTCGSKRWRSWTKRGNVEYRKESDEYTSLLVGFLLSNVKEK